MRRTDVSFWFCLFLLRIRHSLTTPNSGVHRPLGRHVELAVQSVKSAFQDIQTEINGCRSKIDHKYRQCSECLRDNYEERYPAGHFPVGNTLMFLCCHTDDEFGTCQLILEDGQMFRKFTTQTQKSRQKNLTVIAPFITEHSRVKRWFPFVKKMKHQKLQNVTFSKKHAFHMNRYLKGKRFNLRPIVRWTRKSKARRGKRWTNLVSEVTSIRSYQPGYNNMGNDVEDKQIDIQLNKPNILECETKKHEETFSVCDTCPDPTRSVISDVCGNKTHRRVKSISDKLRRIQEALYV
ncbi:uncharacterized protein [Argopecten irradians]|uniref:uncharacterized protein n=1 Tax=Argopecten irradians TaxID=31199 RepID=UPI0037134CD5